MVRTILIGLDGSECSNAAVELGIAWGRRFDSLLVGLAVINWAPTCRPHPILYGAGEYRDRTGEEAVSAGEVRLRPYLENFSHRCREERLGCDVIEDVGRPDEQIVLEAQRYDLVLLGQHTYFSSETIEDAEASILGRVLRNSPRPVVTTPIDQRPGNCVLVAYDGSPQASKALFAFQATRLDFAEEVHVLSVAESERNAALAAYNAAEYLRFHNIKARSLPVATKAPPSGVILDHADRLGARLIVMGAFGETAWRKYRIGSVTHDLLQSSATPLFLYH